MKRIALFAAAATLSFGIGTAQAVDIAKDSTLGKLVGLVVSMQACSTTPTQEQMAKLATAGQAEQEKAGATDADMDAFSKTYGDGKPAAGCDKFNADFGTLLDAALAK